MSLSPVRLLWCGAVQTAPRRLRDAGHEVVVLDDAVSAEQLAAVAEQEDVAVVAVADADLGAAVAQLLGAEVIVFWVTPDPGASHPGEPRV